MIKKTIAVLVGTLILQASADAQELNLVCLISKADRSFDVRSVTLGQSSQNVTLKRSSQPGAPRIQTKQYAVVSKIVPAPNGGAPLILFYTLTAGEFSVVQIGAKNFRFTDLLARYTAECKIEQIASAQNPASMR